MASHGRVDEGDVYRILPPLEEGLSDRKEIWLAVLGIVFKAVPVQS